jgi:nitric oxide-associated protein 1
MNKFKLLKNLNKIKVNFDNYLSLNRSYRSIRLKLGRNIEEKVGSKLPILTSHQRDLLKQLQPNQVELSQNDIQEMKETIKRIKCCGCGGHLQIDDKYKHGFIEPKMLKLSLIKEEKLNMTNTTHYIRCLACKLALKDPKILSIHDTPYDYDKMVLDRIIHEGKAHVIILIDLLDIPNSIYDGWSKLIYDPSRTDALNENKRKNIDIFIIGNKLDLLPNTGPKYNESMKKCLIENCARKGITGEQIKLFGFISAKNDYSIENMINRMIKLWNDEGDVYLLGVANAGKSLLFNKLIRSDYCRSIAADAVSKATTSFWPGTTLDFLKFPIRFFNDFRLRDRRERLRVDNEKLLKEQQYRDRKYKETNNLKYAEVHGIVGSTFKQNKTTDFDAIDEASYSFDLINREIISNENALDTKTVDKKKEIVKNARIDYNPKYFKNKSAWFYDTPGVLNKNKKILQ